MRNFVFTLLCFVAHTHIYICIALRLSVAPLSYLVCPFTTAASFQHNSSHRHCPVKAEADASWPRPQERVPASVEGRGHGGADDRQQPRNIWRGNATLAGWLAGCQTMTFILQKENSQKPLTRAKTTTKIRFHLINTLFCTVQEHGQCSCFPAAVLPLFWAAILSLLSVWQQFVGFSRNIDGKQTGKS